MVVRKFVALVLHGAVPDRLRAQHFEARRLQKVGCAQYALHIAALHDRRVELVENAQDQVENAAASGEAVQMHHTS